MSNALETIRRFIYTPGKSCTEISSFLKNLGGSEQEGLKCLAEYFLKEGDAQGSRRGERRGAIKGSAGTLIILGGANLIKDAYQNHKAKKKHGEESLRILRVIRDCEQGGDASRSEDEHIEQEKKFHTYSAETGERLTDADE